MRLVFIDDSEQVDPPRRGLGRLLAIGAVVFAEGATSTYSEGLLRIRSELSIPSEEEIKWNPPHGSFLREVANSAVRSQLRQQMLELAIGCDVRSAVVVLDHSRVWRDRSRPEVGQEILAWLYERVSMCLADLSDVGIVIADKPGGGAADEARWLTETLRLTNDGTRHVPPGRVILPVVTAPSHHVPHLQLADLVVSASCAAVAGRRSGLALAPLLLQLAHKHSLRYAGGAGIVLWPPELMNLLFWAFGETTWARPSLMMGYGLPREGIDYADDDGL